ncbi:MAG: bacterial proteasome activator family protein [Cumulibacter sp.]
MSDSEQDNGPTNEEAAEQAATRRVVVGPDGQPIGQVDIASDAQGADGGEGDERPVTDMVEQPAKVMRIGTMVKQLLEEVRSAPLDEASRQRLRGIYQQSITELEDGLAPELQEELERLSLPFTEDEVPTDAELRIAQAQLVGWLEGLFHGIQTALFAQQMASRVALEQMRAGGQPAALPPGLMQGGQPGMPQRRQGDDPAAGQYL